MTGLVWFLIILAIVLAIWVVGMFNRLVVLKNRVAEADSDVDVQLKRRHNLIPNIVNTVKGYATHESEVFERVTQARSAAVGAASGNMQNKAQAENALTSTLRSLF